MKHLLFISFSFVLSNYGLSQAGFLDQTFGSEGKVYTDIGGECLAAAFQPDGKILVGGRSNYYEYTLIRYLSDGRLDSSFGENGISALKLSESGNSGIHVISLLSDGSILTSGSSNGNGIAVKFTKNGIVDSSFDNNGLAVIDFGELEVINAMQVQTDGKIVLGGFTRTGVEASLYMVLVRLNGDGSIDESFGDEGRVVDKSGLEHTCLGLQGDGKIITGGHLKNYGAGTEDKFLISRYTTEGILDSSFGTNGTVLTDITDANDLPFDISILNDGKIVAAGVAHYTVTGNSHMVAVKYNMNGELDQSFGEKGISNIFFDGFYSEARSLLVQSDGKLIIGGFVYNGNVYNFAIVRLHNDGVVDSSFGVNGRQITDFGGIERSHASILQTDGKIVLAGEDGIPPYNYLLARYNNDIAMPLQFTYFHASPTNNGGIALNWQTAQENNNNYFAVERTANNSFTEIARINSQGNSAQAQLYSYTDNAPLQGTNFYRLKQVDEDGKFSYSQIVSATVQDGLTVVLYPNPVKDILNIKGLDAEMSYELSVMSAKGNIVAKTAINNTSSYKWNLRSLSKGVYYLQAESGKLKAESKKTTVKFVKE